MTTPVIRDGSTGLSTTGALTSTGGEEICINEARQIAQLHDEINATLRTSLEKAITIGELLHHAKAKLPHGAWLPWIEANLPFSARTATNYMRVFDERKLINQQSAADLSSALQLLAAPSITKLSEAERAELCELENIIEPQFEKFIEGCVHLAIIRDKQLYRGQSDSFADYCKKNFNFGPELLELVELFVPTGTCV
ncbi:MAG: DUF3102 domain-containing protein [Verrucomicrobiota bacterium]